MLQAVRVFLRDGQGRTFPGCAPLPTFLRKEPRTFNPQQPATAFYLGLGLKNKLDTKVLDFVDTCPSIVKESLASILNPWFMGSANKSLIKKDIPRSVHETCDKLDTLGNNRHKLGSFDPTLVTPPVRPPSHVREVACRLVLVHFTSQNRPRMGLLEFSLDVRGAKEKCYAFFTLKTVVLDQRSFGDVTNLVSVSVVEDLVMNAQLMSENSKVPYVATAVWQASDGRPNREGLDLNLLTEQLREEWRKNTDVIVRKWTGVHSERHERERKVEQEAVMKRAEEALANAGVPEKVKVEEFKMDTSGPVVKEEFKEEEDLEEKPWKWEPNLVEWVGSVEKVINNNFALAVSYQRCGWDERRFS